MNTNFVAQCSMVSRLAYLRESDAGRVERLLRLALDCSPDVFNRAMTGDKACTDGMEPATLGNVLFVKHRSGLRALVFRRHLPGSSFAPRPTVFVSFKGTNSIMDAVRDVKAGWSRLCEGLPPAHAGFVAMLSPCMEEVTRAVRARLRDGDRLVVTGHSMGGALADLYSAAIGASPGWGLPSPDCVTFGEPRIWRTLDGLPAASSGYYRVSSIGDPVVAVPPWLYHRRSGRLAVSLRSQQVLNRFANRPRLSEYVLNVSRRVNARAPPGCATKKGQSAGGEKPGHRQGCHLVASLGVCHSIYMDVGYLDVVLPL